jgi:hypothetical protein
MMLRIMIAWAQLETGMGFALLEYPERKVPRAWLQSIWTGLVGIKETVYKDRRANDCHLMDQICESSWFTDPQIRRTNACRLYLKVTLLSDITTACGRQVHQSYYDGDKGITHNWATVRYLRQAPPNKLSWAFW